MSHKSTIFCHWVDVWFQLIKLGARGAIQSIKNWKFFTRALFFLAVTWSLSARTAIAMDGWKSSVPQGEPQLYDDLKHYKTTKELGTFDELGQPPPPPQRGPSEKTQGSAIPSAITELAESLGNNITNIFWFCKHQIKYEAYHGLKKGSLVTYQERSGSPLDQACLLRDLLVASGIQNVSYVRGSRIVEHNQLRGSLQIPEAYDGPAQQADAASLRASAPADMGILSDAEIRDVYDIVYLLDGYGVPISGLTHQGDLTYFLVHSFWIQVQHEGQLFQLDAALPVVGDLPGIPSFSDVDLSDGSNVSSLSQAAGGQEFFSGQEVEGLNIDQLYSRLTLQYQSLTQAYVAEKRQFDYFSKLGGISSDPRPTAPLRLQAMRAVDFATAPSRPLDVLNSPPFEVMHGFSMVLFSQDLELTFSEVTIRTYALAGRPVEFRHDGRQLNIDIDGEEWYSDSFAPEMVTGVRVEFTTPNPRVIYGSATGSASLLAIGATMEIDTSPQTANVLCFGFNAGSGVRMLETRERLQALQAENPSGPSSRLNTRVLALAGHSYIQQASLATKVLNDRLLTPDVPYVIGGMVRIDGGILLDMPLYAFAPSLSSADSNAPNQIRAQRYERANTIKAILLSALEHSAVEQLLGEADSAISTVSGLLKFAADGGRVLHYSGTDQTTVNRLYGNSNFSPEVKTDINNYLVNFGSSRVLTIDTANFRWGGRDSAVAAFIAPGLTRMEINGAYHGGHAINQSPDGNVDLVEANLQRDASSGFQYEGLVATMGLGPVIPARVLSFDPIDMGTGAFVLDSTDLAFGSGYRPGLNFTRSYSSNRRSQEFAGLGKGWTHNFDIRLREASNPLPILGRGAPRHQIPTLFAIDTIDAILKRSSSAKNLTMCMAVGNWLTKQMVKNSVSVSMGPKTLEFIRMPDGHYEPPPGVQARFYECCGGWELVPANGSIYTISRRFKLCNKVTDPYQRITLLNWDNGRLLSVIDPDARRFDFTHNAQGNITEVLETCGNQTRSVSYTYDSHQNLLTTTNPKGDSNRYLVSPGGLITGTFDENEQMVVTNIYDSAGRVRSQLNKGVAGQKWTYYFSGYCNFEIDPLGGTTTHIFDDRTRNICTFDQLGRPQVNRYDDEDRVVATAGSKRTAYGPAFEVRTTYDVDHNPVSIVSVRSETTLAVDQTYNVFDDRYQLLESRNPRSHTVRNEYNDKYQLVRSWDRKGNLISSFEYDPTTGDLIKETMGNVYEVVYSSFDAYGNPRLITKRDLVNPTRVWQSRQRHSTRGDMTNERDPQGNLREYTHDENRRLLTTTLPPLEQGQVATTIESRYDAVGNLTWLTDAKGQATTFTYSPTRKLLSTTLPPTEMGTAVDSNTYDVRDWFQGSWNPIGLYSFVTKDRAGADVTTSDPLLNASSRQFNRFGEVIRTANANGEGTEYEYNIRGERTRQTNPLGNATEWTFDEAGNKTAIILPGNRTYSFTYDSNNQLTKTRTPLGHEHLNEYDDIGRLVRTSEPSGDAIEYELDANGSTEATIFHQAGGGSHRIEFERDRNGNRKTTFDTLRGNVIRRTFDAWDRVASYTNEDGEILHFEYDDNDNLTKLIYPNGDAVTYTYDAHDQMKTVTDWLGRRTEYVYDLNGRLVVTMLPNGTQRRNVFDEADRLVGRHELAPNGDTIFYSLFRYDPAGQITEEVQFPPAQPDQTAPLGTFSATYDLDNRLQSLNGYSSTFDADGNVLDCFAGTFSYDSRNRLTSSSNVGSPTTYSYDAENVLIATPLPNGTTRYMVNPNHGLSKTLKRYKDGKTTRYVHGVGLLYETTGNDLRVYHYDYRGSTVAISDEIGQVTDRFTYSPYGVETRLSGETDTPFRFNGQYGVKTIQYGLQKILHMRARFYSPSLRRFLNADPIQFGGGNNWYAYANGNPVSNIDPFGLFSLIGALEGFSNFVAGAGDTLTFGLTARFRESLPGLYGSDGGVDKSSISYGVGEVTGTGLSLAIGGGGTQLIRGGRALNLVGGRGRQGIYVFDDATRGMRQYVGQSNNIGRRLGQHGARVGSKPRTYTVRGNRQALDSAEQQMIERLGGVPNLANRRNQIGAARKAIGYYTPRISADIVTGVSGLAGAIGGMAIQTTSGQWSGTK